MLPDWIATAITRLPRSSARILTYLASTGIPVNRPDGSSLIVSEASYHTLQETCRLTAAGVSFGIRTAKAAGWLVPFHIESDAPTVYVLREVIGTKNEPGPGPAKAEPVQQLNR